MWTVFFFVACTSSDEQKSTESAPEPPPERVVLHEVFSGSNCGPCAPAADNIAAALADHSGRYALIKYQIGSDPYITKEAVDRRMFYLPDEETYGIPFVHADGFGFHPNNMDENETPYSSDHFLAFAEDPTILGINLDAEVTDQTVLISIELKTWEDVSAENLRLMVSINEKTTYQNVGSNEQTEFHHVFKKFVPDNEGTLLPPLLAGESMEYDFSYTFAGSYDEDAGFGSMVNHSTAHTVEEFDDLEVLVWVQDMDTWEVYNSAWTGHE